MSFPYKYTFVNITKSEITYTFENKVHSNNALQPFSNVSVLIKDYPSVL